MVALTKAILDKLQVKHSVVQARTLQELKDAVDRDFKDIPWGDLIIVSSGGEFEFIILRKAEADLLWWKMKLAPVINAAFDGK